MVALWRYQGLNCSHAIAAPPSARPQQSDSRAFMPVVINLLPRKVFVCGKQRSQNCDMRGSLKKRKAQFVVPPLGGSVWRHGMDLHPRLPPKGGTTNLFKKIGVGGSGALWRGCRRSAYRTIDGGCFC